MGNVGGNHSCRRKTFLRKHPLYEKNPERLIQAVRINADKCVFSGAAGLSLFTMRRPSIRLILLSH